MIPSTAGISCLAEASTSAARPISSLSSILASGQLRLPHMRRTGQLTTISTFHQRRQQLIRTAASSNNNNGNEDTFRQLRRLLGMDTVSDDDDDLAPVTRPSKRPLNVTPGNEVADIEEYFASSGYRLQMPSMDENGTPTEERPITPLDEWSAGPGADWDDWASAPAVADLDDDDEVAELREQVIERRRARRGKRTIVRDEYLRPIVDATGIYNRLAIGEKEAEERVFIEAITNQYESREALKYGGLLLAAPLAVGFIISQMIANPLWNYAEELNPDAFALTMEQKVAGAEAMHREEIRLRLESSLGQAPTLTDEAMLSHLHDEAIRFEADMKKYNRQSLLNLVSDSCSGATLFVLLLRDNSQREILFRTIGRVFAGLSDTAKAFLIIVITDTLLGFHSEEGWTAGLTLLSQHYGWHAQKSSLQLFVATVPVLLDSLFKYWIFVGLNKVDPAAAVTLRQMDRH